MWKREDMRGKIERKEKENIVVSFDQKKKRRGGKKNKLEKGFR